MDREGDGLCLPALSRPLLVLRGRRARRERITNEMNVGGWTVLPEQNLLQRDGQSIKLEPRAIELLVYLARRPGKVVTAQDLMADVWRGRIVEDSAIYKRINELRKAFGDDAREPRFIETIPKRGYRLVATVARISTNAAPADGDGQPQPADEQRADSKHGNDASLAEGPSRNEPVVLPPMSRATPSYFDRKVRYALVGTLLLVIGLGVTALYGPALTGKAIWSETAMN